jgi:hypothetical protein
MSVDLQTRAWDEVVARHAFFVDWFTGKAPDAAMHETARCFASDFHMIAPDGHMLERDAVLSMLQGARGSRTDGRFAIEVALRQTSRPATDLALIVYDEMQSTEDGFTKRRSTAVFASDRQAPSGVVWRHLHETWITTDQSQ